MKRTPLKRLRIEAGLTQQELATKLRVSQPSYQRWETGAAAIPEARAESLARILNVTQDELRGGRKPFDYSGTEKGIKDDRKYFGEVAVHFTSGLPPLLLPISESGRRVLTRQLNGSGKLIALESLDNRSMFIRRDAVSEAYLSSEAYDDFGPGNYEAGGHLGIYPDDDFWTLLGFLEDPESLEGFEQAELEAVRNTVLSSDEDADPEKLMERFHRRATRIEWRLSTGEVRDAFVTDSDELGEWFIGIEFHPEIAADMAIDPYVEDTTPDFIDLAVEAYHRSIFINTSHLDWISLPRHLAREAILAEFEEALEEREHFDQIEGPRDASAARPRRKK